MSYPVTAAQYEVLITSEHRGQPDLTATVDLSVQPFADEQNVVTTFPARYDVDVAVGVQLDAVGEWVGVTRYVATPLVGVYFAWDTAGLGWGQGVWQGPFDPSTGLTTLNDDIYRLLIKARIIANGWRGTVAEAMPALSELFSGSATPGTRLFVEDNLDMTMSFVVAGQLPPVVFLALLASGELDLKPVGVGVNYLQTSVDGAPVFGFDVNNSFIGGWDQGAWAVPISP